MYGLVKGLTDCKASGSQGTSLKTATLHEVGSYGMEDIIASESIEPGDLRFLLEGLAKEDCAHSWKNFDPDGSLDELRAWENRLRPTKIFFFYLKHSNEIRLVAASVVADRLTRDFPHLGFPVLGRCYIMPEFRGQGFYRPILRYRLEYCKKQLGDELKAIHMGANDERISRVLRNHRLSGWPTFIHLGVEELRIAEQAKRVDAYMLLVPEYLRKIRHALSGAHAPQCVIELRNAVSKTESGNVRNLGKLIKEPFEEACRQGWFDEREAAQLEQLLLFCRSIPLLGLG